MVMICMMIMTSDPRYAIGSLCGDIVFNATASIIMNDSSMSTVPVRSSSNTVAAVTPPHVNKRRKRYTFKEKADILHTYHDVGMKDTIAQYGVKRQTLEDWIRDEKKIVSKVNDCTNSGSKKYSDRSTVLPTAFDAGLYKWIQYQIDNGSIIVPKILQCKAKELAAHLSVSLGKNNSTVYEQLFKKFSFSDKWVQYFMKRYKVPYSMKHGEGGSAPMDAVATSRQQLPHLLSTYNARDIYNVDEFALFYQLLPDRTLEYRNNVNGVKKSKMRITVVMCVNADGTDVRKPLVIGRAENPRCFRDIDMNSMPAIYKSSAKAWINTILFKDWLNLFNADMSLQDRNVILTLDNVSTHKLWETNEKNERVQIFNLSNTKLQYFPPHTTSHLQPLDAGIINAIKAYYKYKLVEAHIYAIDTNKPFKNFDIYDAIMTLYESIKQISKETIYNCWKHTKILHTVHKIKIYDDTVKNILTMFEKHNDTNSIPNNSEVNAYINSEQNNGAITRYPDNNITDIAVEIMDNLGILTTVSDSNDDESPNNSTDNNENMNGDHSSNAVNANSTVKRSLFA
jgi:hypothetical protein